MAWNRYYIFVTNVKSTDIPEILTKLGLGQYKPQREVTLSDTNKPTTLFAGVFNGNLLLVHQDLVFTFFGPEQSDEERRFIETFPESEIAALVSNESVNLFSFAIIDKGKKIRMMDGCNGEIYNNVGAPLPEEQELLSEEIFMPEELEEMTENGMTEEQIQAMIAGRIGYQVSNRLTKRYLGEEVLLIDPHVVKLTMYSV
jgi:hypothetical protein